MVEIFLWIIGIVIFLVILVVTFISGMVIGVIMYYADQEAMGEAGPNECMFDRQKKEIKLN